MNKLCIISPPTRLVSSLHIIFLTFFGGDFQIGEKKTQKSADDVITKIHFSDRIFLKEGPPPLAKRILDAQIRNGSFSLDHKL